MLEHPVDEYKSQPQGAQTQQDVYLNMKKMTNV